MRTSPYLFPAVVPELTPREQVEKIASEVDELREALAYDPLPRVVEEALDVVHATETLLRLLASNDEVVESVREVTEKNRLRGYYGD